jgi:hypothetical protein
MILILLDLKCRRTAVENQTTGFHSESTTSAAF